MHSTSTIIRVSTVVAKQTTGIRVIKTVSQDLAYPKYGETYFPGSCSIQIFIYSTLTKVIVCGGFCTNNGEFRRTGTPPPIVRG